MNLFTRREADREKWGDRLPPGQKPTDGWPVLHYGSIPRIDTADWKFEMGGLVGARFPHLGRIHGFATGDSPE
jgi:DMSO/TMAO reductase YedYZ molybdopterin-dependent catalytic subunit